MSTRSLPERLSLDLRPEIPDGVDDRSGRQVNDALLRSEPPQLAVTRERAPEGAHVREDVVETTADDEGRERLDRRATHLVAAADREREAVADDVFVVGTDDGVGGRVVRIRVHRIGPV
jgi:hypothetical protein